MSHEQVRLEIGLTFAALSPFLLRAFGHIILDCILQKYCKMNTKQLKKHLTGNNHASLSIKCIWNDEHKITWKEAKNTMEINMCASVLIATIRLSFWHWLQPALYSIFLYGYWDLLDAGQRIFGLAVLGRESVYFLLTLVGICSNPVYLLPDYKASWTESKKNVFIYVLAPEKYIMWAIFRRDPFKSQFERRETYESNNEIISFAQILLFLFLFLMDLSGIIALIWSIGVHNVYPAMIIGYSMTAVEFLVISLICAFEINDNLYNY